MTVKAFVIAGVVLCCLSAAAQDSDLAAIDIAIVFDDTGSMGDEIEELQAEVLSFVEDIQDRLSTCTSVVRFALATFSDVAEIDLDLTSDGLAVEGAVLDLVASGGGDAPEASLDAVDLAHRELDWAMNSHRFYLVISDATAHFEGDGSGVSRVTMDGVIQTLQASAARAFVVSPRFSDDVLRCTQNPDGEGCAYDLRRLAVETAGDWFDIRLRTIGDVLGDLLDEVAPDIMGTMTVAPDQVTPTSTLPIVYHVTFSVDVIGFDSDDTDDVDVTFTGSAAVTDYFVTGSGTDYDVFVTAVSNSGTVVPVIPEGVATGVACVGSNSEFAGPPVEFDALPTNVTISRATDQPHFTNALPIVFEVIFDDAVTGFDANDFDDFDVLFSGTSAVLSHTVAGSGTEYVVVVNNVSGDGSIFAVVPPNVTMDALGNPNSASVNIDNVVVYDATPPVPTITLAAGQAATTNVLPIVFDVLYTERVSTFGTAAPGPANVRFTGSATGITYHVETDAEFDAAVRNGGFEFGTFEHWSVMPTPGASGTFYIHDNNGLTPLGTHTSVGPAVGNYFAISDQTGPGGAVMTQPVTTDFGLGGETILHFDLFVDSVGTGETAAIFGPIDSDADPNQYGTVDLLELGTNPFTETSGVLMNLYLDVDPGVRPVPYTRRTFDITPVVEANDGHFLLRFGQVATENTTIGGRSAFFNMGIDRVGIENVFTGLFRKYRIVVTAVGRNGTVIPELPQGAGADLATNASVAYDAPARTVVYDNLPPTIFIGAPSAFETATGPIVYTITYSGAAAVTLSPADVSLVTTRTAAGAVLVSGAGTQTRQVTVTEISGEGTIGIRLAAGTAIDLAGNLALEAGPSTTFAVDPTLAPRLVVSAADIPFGEVPLGRFTDRVVTVTNVGASLLEGSVTTSAPFAVTVGSPYVLEPGASQEVAFRFEPDATGEASDVATFTGGGGSVIVLRGEGVPADGSILSVSPRSIDFNFLEVGASRTVQLRVANTGTEALDGETAIPQAFAIVRGSPYRVDPGESTIVELRFSPLQAREYNEQLVLTGGGGALIPIRGVAVAAVTTLRGAVTDGDDHVLPNAAVAVFQGEALVASATVDGFGVYSISTIPSGRYTVRAVAPGFVGGQRLVDLAGATTTANFSLEPLAGEPELRGMVTGADDEGSLGGVRIDVEQDGAILATTFTSSDGSYELDPNVDGDVRVIVSQDGFEPREFDQTIVSGTPLTLNISLTSIAAETGTLRGRVMNGATNRGVRGASVFVRASGASYGAMSGSDGHFQIANVPAGFVEISASAAMFEPFGAPLTLTHFGEGSLEHILELAPVDAEMPMEAEGEPGAGCDASGRSESSGLADVITVYSVVALLAARQRSRPIR